MKAFLMAAIVLLSVFSTIGTAAETKMPITIIMKEQPIGVLSIMDMKVYAVQTQSDILTILKNSGAENIKSLWIVNAISADVTPDLIEQLKLHPDVKSVENVIQVHMLAETCSQCWGIIKINAKDVWDAGITGAGVKIAVIDTGIDATHPILDDLDDNPATNDPKVIGWIDIVNGVTTPYDDHGHGTHVSGTAAGTMGIGVAPGAQLMGAKVLGSGGWGTDVTVSQGVQWAVENGADVISISLGGSHSTLLGNTVNNAINAGVVVVAAAGNSGPGPATIKCPADENKVIAVGATDSDDNIASFSSRGPVTLNGETYIKPDVSAPGVSIYSSYPGGGYVSWSGTSMATPHVSGTVALMLQNDSNLTPANIKQRLENTSIDLGDVGKDNTYGAGRIDTYRAAFNIGEPFNPIGIYGTVYNDVNNNKIRDVGEVGLQNWKVSIWGFVGYVYVNKITYTDVNGMYKFTELQPASYSLMLTVQSPYIGTTPTFYSGIIYHNGESIKKDFGVRRLI